MSGRQVTERALGAFGRWFASAAGVWQTFGISVAVTGAEFAFPHLDPNGFKWLYLCTVWSFFTQNALAYSSRVDADRVQRELRRILREERRIERFEQLHEPKGQDDP